MAAIGKPGGEGELSLKTQAFTCASCFGRTWEVMQNYPKTTLTVIAIVAVIINAPLLGLVGCTAMLSTKATVLIFFADGALSFTAYKVLTATKQAPKEEFPTGRTPEEKALLGEVARKNTKSEHFVAVRVSLAGGDITGVSSGDDGVLRAFDLSKRDTTVEGQQSAFDTLVKYAGRDATVALPVEGEEALIALLNRCLDNTVGNG